MGESRTTPTPSAPSPFMVARFLAILRAATEAARLSQRGSIEHKDRLRELFRDIRTELDAADSIFQHRVDDGGRKGGERG